MRLPLMALCLILLSCKGNGELTTQENYSVTVEKDVSHEVSLANEVNQPLKEVKAMFTVTGTIVYKEMEGGFYGLDTSAGKKYQPLGLPLEYRKNGLVVEVSGTLETEMASIHQYGEVLKVQSVKVLDSSKVIEPNSH